MRSPKGSSLFLKRGAMITVLFTATIQNFTAGRRTKTSFFSTNTSMATQPAAWAQHTRQDGLRLLRSSSMTTHGNGSNKIWIQPDQEVSFFHSGISRHSDCERPGH